MLGDLRIMVCIRYTERDGCDVSGNPSELRAIEDIVKQLAVTGVSQAIDADAQADPRPYDRLLHRLMLRVTSGPVCVSVRGDDLDISAGAEFMTGFASFFAFDDDTPIGHHQHHEYWDGNAYVSPDSTPLVVSIGRTP